MPDNDVARWASELPSTRGGTEDYAATSMRIRSENATKSIVTATITGDPQRIDHSRRREARVRWVGPTGSGTAVVAVPVKSVRGDEISVWLGPGGDPTAAPEKLDAAVMEGVGAALAVLLITAAGAVGLIGTVGWVLLRRRGADWEKQWLRVCTRIREEGR
ncbi:hypothetical protein AB0M22_17540 [Nocardia sp. NPDC051756]|uniref:hypothetical protein n=1 Tax=Nocardia sp. NPDC051756 TaxID=3154751 RepID=UPI003425AAAF